MEPSNLSHDHEWIVNIWRSIEGDIDDDLTSVSIFNVPKPLLSTKPEAYIPQVLALGPYHHRRLELFEMERHKLTAAKKLRKKLQSIDFCDLVAHIAEKDIQIRSCYHRYLDFDRETLAWMFVIDVSCSLQYLRTYPDRRRPWPLSFSMRNSLKMGHLMDYTRRKTWHQAVLRDIIMVENQIPLFLLREVYGFYHDQSEDNISSDQILASMLLGFCKDLAPIKHIDERGFKEKCFKKAHLLELLYHSIVPNLEFPPDIKTDKKDQKEKQEGNKKEIGCFKATINSIFQFITLVFCALFKIFKSKIFMQLITVPWKLMISLLKIRVKSNTVSEILSSAHDVIEEAESTVHVETDESPLVEEIAIPSVTELSKIGVVFRPTKGGLNTIEFIRSSATLYLPVIHLNDNSDVVLRNLVAFEACIAPEAMVLTRYTELMNGIIDTEEDVRILREAGILVNRLKSDKEVASIWNGMTTSVKVTRVPIIDKAIEGVNAYYATSWKVKVKQTMKKYVYASWPFLTFLAANIVIWLSVVETICSMYRCSKWLGAL